MFFVILPNKKVIKFINFIMMVDFVKFFYFRSFETLIIKVNNCIVESNFLLIESCFVNLFFNENKKQLFVLGSMCKYLMANAVKILFPFSVLGFGNVVGNGFYYDFELDFKLSSKILEKLEKQIYFLLEKRFLITIFLSSAEKVKKIFFNNEYKINLINKTYESNIYIYKCGSFLDICNNIYKIFFKNAFFLKLIKVSGAYWMGNSSNIMLQRIEGFVSFKYEQLNDYILSLNDVRDHRLLGKKYDLFHFQNDTCGMIFWHKDGWIIYQEIIKYLRNIFFFNNYLEVNTPQLINKNLWKMSGHLDKFSENMYSLFSDNDFFILKPMNCPAHVQIFKNSIKSYKDLPIKYCEFGSCYRKEFSGALHGIMRVKNFIQDDGHIFCTENQIQREVILFIKSLFVVYKKFLFKNILIKLATRPEKRVGEDFIWDKAEKSLVLALNKLNLNYFICKGEGAFYGPKIEFTLKDNIGRLWQCGTIQVDFFIPKRLNSYYINRYGFKQFPIILHRAIIGSIERFMGILLEDNFGNFSLWLCPIQIIVLNITANEISYSKKICDFLKKENIRVSFDFKNDKISLKIRNASIRRIPYLLIVGKNEVTNELVSVRTRDSNDLGAMKIDIFLNMFNLCLFN
ncbi:MAG: threonine--tRNA ligase [Candidatus Azosocius agrarius]|nr:MAG: threonine--tRNA ligase [Gammaproteobacteria bacterium]